VLDRLARVAPRKKRIPGFEKIKKFCSFSVLALRVYNILMFRVFWRSKNLLSSFGSGTWQFSPLQVRFNSGGQKNGRPAPDSLSKLKLLLSERKFNNFQMEFKSFSLGRKHDFLSDKERMEVSSLLHARTLHLINDQESANVLRNMGNLKYTVFRSEDRTLIDEILGKYLTEKKKSVKWFPLFLTALKSVKYNWKLLEQPNRKKILELFDEMSTRKDMNERQYSEILNGIAGLGIGWKVLNESTRKKLLERLPEMQTKLEGISMYSVVFTYGKLSVNIKEVSSKPIEQAFLQIAIKALERIKSNKSEDLDRNRDLETNYTVCIVCLC
jgi:predicted Fe-S protein YdhL (DUF1289 family)